MPPGLTDWAGRSTFYGDMDMPTKPPPDQITSAVRIESARGCIQDAIRELTAIVVEECDGYREFSPGYQMTLMEVFQKLVALRDRI